METKNTEIIEIIKEQLHKNQKYYLTVTGNSMFPTIKDRQKVQLIPAETISNNDIIAYYLKSDEKYDIIVHRIVSVRNKFVLTKGDNNDFLDPLRVSKDIILGKIIL